MLRGKWAIFYFAFFLLLTSSLLFFSGDLSKAILSLMNVVLLLIPLISTIMAVTYYYNSLEFAELLLAQPIKRSSVFMGRYLGISLSLGLAFILGTLIPFLCYYLFASNEIWNFVGLLFAGFNLTLIFSALAFLSCTIFNDKIKGFGVAVIWWLFMAVVYDGLVLLIMVMFKDYPLETPALILSFVNPIDLDRTMLMLKLDIAAMLGYTGAVFKEFFGKGMGMAVTGVAILFWITVPIWAMLRVLRKKDFY